MATLADLEDQTALLQLWRVGPLLLNVWDNQQDVDDGLAARPGIAVDPMFSDHHSQRTERLRDPIGHLLILYRPPRPAEERASLGRVGSPAMARYRYLRPLRWGDMDAYVHVNNVLFLRYHEVAA